MFEQRLHAFRIPQAAQERTDLMGSPIGARRQNAEEEPARLVREVGFELVEGFEAEGVFLSLEDREQDVPSFVRVVQKGHGMPEEPELDRRFRIPV
jgi:hypothetical protein